MQRLEQKRNLDALAVIIAFPLEKVMDVMAPCKDQRAGPMQAVVAGAADVDVKYDTEI